MTFPTYSELDRPDATGLPLAKGVWGPDDQLGMLNHATPAKAAEASRLVSDGRRFNLDLPLHLPFEALPPKAHVRRMAPRPTLFRSENVGLIGRDDKLDDFFLQGSSQWDGLTHVGDPTQGFYNGVADSQVTQGEGTRNGIDRVAEFCIFTRGVLADLPRYFSAIGRGWSVSGSGSVSAEELGACLAWQGVQLSSGDVLLVRTGWLSAFLGADAPQRAKLFGTRDYSGLSGKEDMWQFMWDNRVAALASDNVAVEVCPRHAGDPSLHWSIARLGLTLGELFFLDDLAQTCAEARRYAFLFVSKPLNLRGGVGSPPNAMAVW